MSETGHLRRFRRFDWMSALHPMATAMATPPNYRRPQGHVARCLRSASECLDPLPPIRDGIGSDRLALQS